MSEKIIYFLVFLFATGYVECQSLSGVSSELENIDPVALLKPLASLLPKFLNIAVDILDSLLPAPAPPPALPQDRLWGDGNVSDHSVRPFRVSFSDKMITDLQARLASRRSLVPALNNSGNTYGTHSQLLDKVLDYWLYDYDFKTREAYLNRHPQFVTNIQGLDVKFIHIRPSGSKRVVPILLLHGFPVTAFEYSRVIDYLCANDEYRDLDFEIVAPDLPGYGYSQHTNEKGLNPYQIGIMMNNLMKRLGHDKYFIHGGDVGSLVASPMAIMYPDKVLGYHCSLPFSQLPKTLVKYVFGQLMPVAVAKPEYVDRLYPISYYARSFFDNFGYLMIQSTKPDQLGHGLDASPVALADWLTQFFVTGGEGKVRNQLFIDGNIYKNYDIDDLIDDYTIYWSQKCMMTAGRFYKELLDFSDGVNVDINFLTKVFVPFAALNFKDEIIYQPDGFIRDKYPYLVQSITLDYGGHFAGFMNPKTLARSIRSAVPKMEEFNEQRFASAVQFV
ncbi:juvenile hormone epoxide hydrolase [Plutella xylostella]|uniref:juvenile hormone epoxide hydrolase n=1 Tax=Plutella xylostella TaxID=51655 RepID=UPI002032867C|nr:juvenile hormone epoxide hydrolase [Plutella xylostella]